MWKSVEEYGKKEREEINFANGDTFMRNLCEVLSSIFLNKFIFSFKFFFDNYFFLQFSANIFFIFGVCLGSWTSTIDLLHSVPFYKFNYIQVDFYLN